eukprot:TRINITY_DN13916_c0_g1_i1.p3 TRINITY_DN13916_c0_g1~~TRINITY_DN13916_c0_g1_i1.p3  ORF type:complete len:57 (-),score=5.13 TRINITY_DN13916_c0_g1_i1:106-276(-)
MGRVIIFCLFCVEMDMGFYMRSENDNGGGSFCMKLIQKVELFNLKLTQVAVSRARV